MCLETRGVIIDLSWRRQKVKYDGSIITPHENYGGPIREIKFAHHVVQFVDQRSGGKITVEGRLGSAPPAYHVGEEVAVLYDPENPSNARMGETY